MLKLKVMKRNNILHFIFYIIATVCCASCEDYTEHNFGKPEDLYQYTQVNTYDITLTPDMYQALATNADNQALAAEDESGVTAEHLQMVAENGCFVGNVTAKEYLPAILKSLVGAGEYYSMTPGSTITIRYKQGDLVPSDAYVPHTGELTKSSKFLLVPKGEEQVLAGSDNEATGQTYGYGYLYTSGSSRYPTAVTRSGETAIVANEDAEKYLYSLEKDGDSWLICNPTGNYLYLDETHNTFQYIDDLGDIEDEMYPSWNITYNSDTQTYSIVNTGNQKVMLFGTQYASAGAYADKLDENGNPVEGYLAIELYALQKGATEVIEIEEDEQEITFTLDEDGWQTKGDYLNQPLTGGTTLSDMDEVYKAYGWSVEYKGSIGDLTYVWRYDAIYGMRSSAYKSSTYYPTDAWAIAPAVNLKKAEKPIFYFEQAQKYADDKATEDDKVTDYLQVWVSTNYKGRGGLEAATWTDVTDKVVGTWPDGSDWTYYPCSIDLSDYVGEKTVNVAFRYISTETVAATWEVKNVVCKEFEEESEEGSE